LHTDLGEEVAAVEVDLEALGCLLDDFVKFAAATMLAECRAAFLLLSSSINASLSVLKSNLGRRMSEDTKEEYS